MDTQCEDSGAPLLDSSMEHHERRFENRCPKCYKARQPWGISTLSIATFVLMLYIAVAVTVKPWTSSNRSIVGDVQQPIRDRFVLANDLLEFEERDAWLPLQEPWNLGPSDEVDALWDDLLHALNVRVTAEEVKHLGLNTTNRVVINGGDYLGVIGSYHHLHCLNNMRIAFHWDYYEEKYRNNSHPQVFSVPHSDHCIDTIRQALMCHANAELHLAEWVDDPHAPGGRELSGQSTTTCLKWDTLDNWARPRTLTSGNYTYRPGPFEANKATWKPGDDGNGHQDSML